MYAFGIARYVRLEALKTQSKHDHLDWTDTLDPSADSYEHPLEKRAELQQLRSAVSKLPEPQQEIILLQINEEMGLKEIGILMAMHQAPQDLQLHSWKVAVRERAAELEEKTKETSIFDFSWLSFGRFVLTLSIGVLIGSYVFSGPKDQLNQSIEEIAYENATPEVIYTNH